MGSHRKVPQRWRWRYCPRCGFQSVKDLLCPTCGADKLVALVPSTEIPQGTPVLVELDGGRGFWETKTRSAPWQMASGHWVVALEGRTGGFALERVMPVVCSHGKESAGGVY